MSVSGAKSLRATDVESVANYTTSPRIYKLWLIRPRYATRDNENNVFHCNVLQDHKGALELTHFWACKVLNPANLYDCALKLIGLLHALLLDALSPICAVKV